VSKRKSAGADQRVSEEARPQATVIYMTEIGTMVRVTFEKIDEEHVRVVEYHRKRKGASNFVRAREGEGQVYPISQIRAKLVFSA